MVAVVVVTDSRSNKVYVYTECHRQASIIRHAQAVIGYCGSVVEWILLGRGPMTMTMPSSLRGPMLIIVDSSSLSRAFWPQCHGLG